jgi:uncharacterized protein (DUF58 family)
VATLRGLTRRGIGLLCAGVVVVIAGLSADVRDLLRIGALLIALPLAAVVVVARNRYRVSCDRTLEPPRVEVGDQSRVTLRMRNVSRLPTAVLLAEDQLPAALGGRPRFTLDRVEVGGQRAATYALTSPVRGRFTIGPLTMRVADPFGLCEVTRSFTSTAELVVTPAVSLLSPIKLGGEWAGGGEARSAAVSSVGEDDIATRPYRHGDDLRRVHWRSSARVGELMVRREEQPWQNRCAILLDSRAGAHRGDGADTSFEAAIEIVASIGTHLGRRGWGLRLILDQGSQPVIANASLAEDLLLDYLADTSFSRGTTLTPGLASLTGPGAHEGLVVAVCGAIGLDDVTALAILIDTASFAGAARDNPRAARSVAAAREDLTIARDRLHLAGWRVLVYRRGEELADRWSDLGVGEPADATTASGGMRP